MTQDQFIEKWNVGYEDFEQKAEFAQEMKNDLASLKLAEGSQREQRLENLLKEARMRLLVDIDEDGESNSSITDLVKMWDSINEELSPTPPTK